MTATLRSRLNYEPVPLKFGTSGRRGLVRDLTQLELYLNASAELQYLLSLPPAEGGIAPGQEFYFACDLRPSSTQFVPEERGRGEIAQAIAAAIKAAGLVPVFLGALPTPALASYALERRRGSMMITGSHIPFDRNGYKTNTARGELLKKDEAPIQKLVDTLRERLYAEPFDTSLFDESGRFKQGHQELPPALPDAREAYLCRYTDFFAGQTLKGKRFLVYQHSAVGRDLLVELLRRLGAQAIPAGRSETFVPIDTENIDEAQLSIIQSLAADAWQNHGPLDAIVSTDGDSDRPLILGFAGAPASLPAAVPPGAPASCRPASPNSQLSTLNPQPVFYGGDLVGMVVAEYLGADAVVVPISCNDALDRVPLKDVVEPKTRIGSPFVIAGMEQALAKGRKAVCGWEANGGFLTGSDIQRQGRTLKALPTRDAFLPILSVLFAAARQALPVSALFERLPRRFSRAALLKQFPRPTSLRILEKYSPAGPRIKEVLFENKGVTLLDDQRRPLPADAATIDSLLAIRQDLFRYFTPALGFNDITRINYTDGVRLYFANGDIAHVRPSGNADELRIYAVADTLARAEAIAKLGIAEPAGILRNLEKAVR